MENLLMRQDHTVPIERKDDERRDGTTGRAQPAGVDEASTEQADGASTEATSPLRSDAPAALSAISRPADIEHAGLSDEEVDEYRRRVASGMYNTREVADEIARRMMRRGDI
jgi:negative regulator of flagellin synthesis FlgM